MLLEERSVDLGDLAAGVDFEFVAAKEWTGIINDACFFDARDGVAPVLYDARDGVAPVLCNARDGVAPVLCNARDGVAP
ncbi:MAG: hypothetical protein ACLFVJ_23695, partial [Persicimonas sp.]